MEGDFAILVLLMACVLLGILRGAVRQLLAFGALFVTFIVAAYARVPIGDWLMQQNGTYTQSYSEMLAFLLSFVVLFGIALAAVEIGGSTIHLSKRPVVDELVGGLVMFAVGVLFVATVVIVLETYYSSGPPPSEPQLQAVRDMYFVLEESVIVQQMHTTLIPGMLTLLNPLLPASVTAGG
jgi:uncharacterized membrane protein required for colicin V production